VTEPRSWSPTGSCRTATDPPRGRVETGGHPSRSLATNYFAPTLERAANDGGTAILSYFVVSLHRSKTCVTRATSCTFKGLNKKLHHSFELRATKAVGSSALSAKSNAVRDV
jgi:hypothetical protein